MHNMIKSHKAKITRLVIADFVKPFPVHFIGLANGIMKQTST